MHIVKSVGVMSIAKILGLVYGCLGIIFVPLFLIMGLAGTLVGVGDNKSPFAGAIGIGLAIFMPIFYGLFGFITGAIGALLYNLFARLIGGFELELEARPQRVAAPYPLIPPANPASNP